MKRRPVGVFPIVLLAIAFSVTAHAGETPEPPVFLRGDANGDGSIVPLLDATAQFFRIGNDGLAPPCYDALDVNDNGSPYDFEDGLRLLRSVFVEDEPPLELECATDSTIDDWDCKEPAPCPVEFTRPATDDRFLVAISNDSARTDDVAMVSITFSGEDGALLWGYQIAVCYDDSLVTAGPGDVVDGEDVVPYLPFVTFVRYEEGGFTIGRTASPYSGPWELNGEMELHDVFFHTLSETGIAAIELCAREDNGGFPLLVTENAEFDQVPAVPETRAGSIEISSPDDLVFLRGDANGDGEVNAIADAVFILLWGFLSGPTPPCMDAADANDSGGLTTLSDALFLLSWGFLSGAAPPPPGADTCGTDPTADSVDCAEPWSCD